MSASARTASRNLGARPKGRTLRCFVKASRLRSQGESSAFSADHATNSRRL